MSCYQPKFGYNGIGMVSAVSGRWRKWPLPPRRGHPAKYEYMDDREQYDRRCV